MRGNEDVDLRVFRGKVKHLKIGQIKEEVMTLADQLIREGRQEGRQEGRFEALSEDILDILDARFGEVPGEVRKMLKGVTDEACLKSLLRRAAVAGSLEEFSEGFQSGSA